MTTTLKNAHSTSTRIFDAIQKTLVAHKARHVTFEYGDAGKIKAIEFTIEIGETVYPFRLPARVENVIKIMYGTYPSQSQKEQAYRTAWANIRDWIAAQCAMIDIGMVKPEEVFLPYMVAHNGRTFFESMVESKFLLESPRE